MDEIKIISSEENKTKIQNLSTEELKSYRNELEEMIKSLDYEIVKRQEEKIKAEKLFKK